MQTETLIIGGGLSGLRLATMLAEAGHDFHIVEARDRLGGRILTQHVDGAYLDLGPAWFWPGQPRIAQLIDDLGLSFFEQYADGILTFEDERGTVERGRGFASMQGSYRLHGGLGALISALGERLPTGRISQSTRIAGLAKTDHGIRATTASGTAFSAQRVVLALPPRLASQITYAPALPANAHRQMDVIATWMAGQAKAIAVYDKAFWRDAGLSGDAISRHGPMVEVHDASPDTNDGPFALFGFIGVPPAARADEAALKEAVRAQFVRLFGPQAATPISLLIKDWAFDAQTSTDLDLQPLFAHPNYGLPSGLKDVWDHRLIFSGTETAAQFGGYIEGALESAENTLARLAKETV